MHYRRHLEGDELLVDGFTSSNEGTVFGYDNYNFVMEWKRHNELVAVTHYQLPGVSGKRYLDTLVETSLHGQPRTVFWVRMFTPSST